jgi:hypothetical protein
MPPSHAGAGWSPAAKQAALAEALKAEEELKAHVAKLKAELGEA